MSFVIYNVICTCYLNLISPEVITIQISNLYKNPILYYTKYFLFCLIGVVIMFKKFFCFILILCIVLSPFIVHASADDLLFEVGLDYLTWFANSTYSITNGSMDYNELMDYYASTEGQLYLDCLDYYTLGSYVPITGNSLSTIVQDANNKKYIAQNLSKEYVDKCFDSLNSYFRVGNSSIRNVDFNDIGVNYGNNDIVVMGYEQGIRSCVSDNLYDMLDDTKNRHLDGYMPTDWADHRNDNIIYVYPGSYDFPPMIFAFCGNISISGLSQVGNSIFIPAGVSGDSFRLMPHTDYLPTSNYKGSISFGYFQNNVNYPFQFRTGTRQYYNNSIYYVSNGINTPVNNDPVNYLQLFTNTIGTHICIDKNTPVPQPSNIPYENNQVVVLSPAEEPGEPVYISPTTYNNYINNGTYTTINEGDNVNYYIDDSTVNNFITVYNNYESGSGGSSGSSDGSYDDTNLLNRLQGWFSAVIAKLNEIINKLPPSQNNPPSDSESDSDINTDTVIIDTSDIPSYRFYLPDWLSWLDPDPCYENFSDCIFNNIQVLSVGRDVLNVFNSSITDSNSSNNIVRSGSSSVPLDGDYLTNLDRFIDYRHKVEPYANLIRPVTSIFAYSIGIIACWKSIKSVFKL